MTSSSDKILLEQINQNLGIAHKVCRVYFSERQDQEDALQEMMYQLWRSHSGFGGHSKFSTWMYRVCLNTAITYRKKYSSKTESLSTPHYELADHPADNYEGDLPMLFAAIHSLSPINKAIILLYLEKLSYEEISEIVGMTKSTVSVRLVRIKKMLETLLKRNY